MNVLKTVPIYAILKSVVKLFLKSLKCEIVEQKCFKSIFTYNNALKQVEFVTDLCLLKYLQR